VIVRRGRMRVASSRGGWGSFAMTSGDMPGIGPSAVYRDGRSARRTPRFLRLPPDRGIRPASNASSGDPSEVADGEVRAHLGNPG
jgi:hypothetical protein